MQNEITSVYNPENSASSNKPKKRSLKAVYFGFLAIIFIIAFVQIINATKYDMTVNVKEGENILGVNPFSDNLDFGDLSRNNGMTRFISLKSDGSMPTYIAVFQIGEISDLVKLDKNFFILQNGKEARLRFEISIPPSAIAKKYSGQVWIFRIPKLI